MASTDIDLEDLAERFTAARTELAALRRRTPEVQATIAELKPQITAAILADIKSGRRTQAEISKLTGYTAERIRQICRAAGVEPP